jgi:drug/metabolite transporter (DMT)-like permease
VIIASIALCFLGVMFGSLPFVPSLRPLPRWIRIALHLSGFALLLAGLLYAALDAAAPRISPHLHRLIFAHVVLIGGMGLGILLLLAISGEYMKALRELTRNRQTGSHV